MAAVLALVLAAVNGNLAATPFDLVPLFLHLLVPAALGAGVAFLLLSSLLLAVLTFYPVRRIETLSLVTAVLAGSAVAALLAARLLEMTEGSTGVAGLVTAALVSALVVAAVVKVVHGALLALAMRWTRAVPERRAISRRSVAVALVVVAGLLLLPPLLAARQEPPPPPVSLPSAPGERVLLVGVDGVLGEELDYLLAAGRLPAARRLLDNGGRLFSYPRPAGPPATFWATVATGHDAAEHGVSSLDSFRPLGVSTPLARSGPLRHYWSQVAVPLGLAEYRPVLSSRRDVFTLWELAAHGGAPVVAVDWWSTFPADPLPGLVVAHGGYQLLEEGATGAVAPEARRQEMAALARRVASALTSAGEAGDGPGEAEGAGTGPTLPGALPEDARDFLASTVLAPDHFYRQAFLAGLAPDTRAAALYLPAPDIAAAGWRWAEVAFADLLAGELAAADHLVGSALDVQRPGAVVLVFDPGRRAAGGGARSEGPDGSRTAGAEGRVLIWWAGRCRENESAADTSLPILDPRAVASALLRAMGLPQSAELPPPPAGCAWPEPATRLPTYGLRHQEAPSGPGAGEYLDSLRALGYL